jgi:hypothetical protein
MIPHRLLPALVLLLIAGTATVAAGAQPAPGHGELWRRQLGEETALIAGVDHLHKALAAGDLSALTKVLRDGPLLLQIASLSMPPTLCGARQTRVLMADYFRVNELEGLRVSQLRLADSGRSARVALDLFGAPLAPGRPDRRRIVARFVRDTDDAPWQIAELRCP